MSSTRFDIIVVGAGIAGLTSALALQRDGTRVAVLDRHRAGTEASWAGGGILCPLYAWRYPAPVLALAAEGMRRYPALLASLDSGIDPERWVTGMEILDPIGDDETAESISATLASADIAHQWRRQGNADALWLPEVANVRNPYLLDALIDTLPARGIELREQCAANGLLLNAGRVAGVATSQGDLHADRVVITAGAWSEGLIPGLPTGSLFPVRGQMLRLEPRPENQLDRIRMDDGVYLIPRRDGSVVVGSTVEYAGFDKTVDSEAQQRLHAHACRLWPQLAEARITHRWAGLRPGSSDELPLLGAHPSIAGLWANTGGFRNGLAMAPASAELLAAQMAGRPTAVDPAPYRLERLIEG
ncbi:glycine oxidase ThiO [Guyparkeria halophila]|uniref:Glycine oxidase ThiO n=1 Tax=Guyparkeria halophila TaxID=47960 RepID=A0ABZ0YXX4_9GAMM|nr:glycine oxidase ThiO [Guyparkeria halophila]WQH16087.1 glycine oxidase ThiO [Guyparkeria halophila]